MSITTTVVCCALCIVSLVESIPIVRTPHTTIYGFYKESYDNREYAAFEGIPYAKPPVGELRFAEPQPLEPAKKIYANNTYVCMQFSPIPGFAGPMGTEDCLYLYVYVPRKEINENDKPLDVIVHIHGGAFVLGAPFFMAGPDYIMDRDVIYVTMNYRLGVMGFLSTEDDVVPGNNGLKDQAVAMKWIKDNIQYFGGNPESITLTGFSAGAVSVHYHYLSPLSRGLFHRGFSQSGTALAPWGLVEDAQSKAKKIGESLNCTIESSQEMIRCLRTKPPKEVASAITTFLVLIDAFPIAPLGPVVEKSGKNPFISEHPYKMLMEGKFANDVPWITSNVKDEGLFVLQSLSQFKKVDTLITQWNKFVPFVLDFHDTVIDSSKADTALKIKQYYLKNKKNVDYYELAKMFTDRLFLSDTNKAIELHAKSAHSPVYYYFMTYLLEQESLFEISTKGIAHADDEKLLFKMFGTPDIFPEKDEQMKNLLVDMVYSYAVKGIPKVGDVDWKAVGDQRNYLLIESPTFFKMDTFADLGNRKFWDSLPIKENQNIFNT